MIVRSIEGQLWLFDQSDHSALCGVMASRWGSPPFADVPRQVQLAAAIHDSGWPEWDVRPSLDRETGRPHPYSDMLAHDYRRIWERGLARGWQAGQETGLLVSLHAMRFFAHKRRAADRRLFADERNRQREVLQRLGSGSADPESLPEPYARWHAWMFFWDGLSLFLCEGWKTPWISPLPTGDGREVEVKVERVEESSAGARVVVEPFPFGSALDLETSARVVPDRPYSSQTELDRVVQDAERETARWRLDRRPGPLFS